MSSSLLIFAGHLTETQPQEIYMDVAWTAWLQVIGDERRQREMPKAQRSKGKIRSKFSKFGTSRWVGAF